jgi:putative membrane protein
VDDRENRRADLLPLYRWTVRYMWGAPFTPIAGMRTGVTNEQMQSPVLAIAILLTCISLFAFFAVLLRRV